MVEIARVFTFPSVEQEPTPVRVPWENSPHGVVSLLAMLEFAAKEFVEISHKFGLILGEANRPSQTNPDVLGDSLSNLLRNCTEIGLNVTLQQLMTLIAETASESPGSFTYHQSGSIQIKDGKLKPGRMLYHVEALYSTMLAEISSHTFKAIPQEKSKYCDPKWLTNTALFNKFPDTVDEFQKAGRCYAFGENVACIFHLMRVTDLYLKRVAESLQISYDSRNWHGIGDKITKEMEKKHQTKTDDWKSKESLYAEILTDIQAIGRGHRNPALHELEKKYDETEARNMLTVIEGFATHVANNL